MVVTGGCAGAVALLGYALGFLEVRDQIANIRDYFSSDPTVTLTVLLDGYVVRNNAPDTLGSLNLGGLPEGTFLLGIVPVSVVPVIGPIITGTVTRQATSGGNVAAAGVMVAAFADGARTLSTGSGPLDITPASAQDYQLAITDDSGHFTLGPCDFLGDWLVTAYSAGYQADARTAHVGSGSDANGITLSLVTDATSPLPATLTGTVSRKATGAVLTGALVRAEPAILAVPIIPSAAVTRVATATGLSMPSGPWFRWSFTATNSGSAGVYSLDFVAGSVRAWAYKFGYKGAYQDTSAGAGTVLPEDFPLPDP
jgi:hypothetical protein